MNVTRLTNSVTQLYKDMISSANLRLTPIVTTDRLVYRAEDYIFVEVLLFDTLKKTPYILPTVAPIPVLRIIATLKDTTGATVGS